jgi:type II secretory pathway pseudopilin PulG
MVLRHSAGLTLVEMLVVVGVIVLLAGFIVSLTLRVENESKEKALGNAFALLKSALREYYDFTGTFPDQPEVDVSKADIHSQLLYSRLDSIPASQTVLRKISQALIVGNVEMGKPLKVCDPWGKAIDYRYTADDTFPEMISAGPDKVFGTADDISSKNT